MGSSEGGAPLRWGVLGTARTARKRMVPAIQRTPGHTCAAVSSRDPERAAGFARDLGIPRAVAGHRALLADPGLEAVYIPAPTGLHAELAEAALAAGKHVLCEKPLALTRAAAERLIAAQAAAGKVLLENFSYPWTPAYGWLAEVVSSGRLGRVRSLQVVHAFSAGPEHAIRFDRGLGGGCLYDLACYGIDLAHRLLGARLGAVAVRALPAGGELAAPGGGRPPAEAVEAELWCRLETAGGVEVTVHAAFVGPRRQSVTVVGEEGTVFLPVAFLAGEAEEAGFLSAPGGSRTEVFPAVDQSSLQVRLLGERARRGSVVDAADQRLWRWNAALLEELRARVDEDLAREDRLR